MLRDILKAAARTQHGSSFFKSLGKTMTEEFKEDEIVAGKFVCNILAGDVPCTYSSAAQWILRQRCRLSGEYQLT